LNAPAVLSAKELTKMVEETKWYPSKVDGWLAVVLAIPPISSVAVFVVLTAAGNPDAWPWGLVPVAFVALLYGGLVVPVTYGLDDEHLTVRFGRVRQKIPLARIVSVKPTNSLLSAPALSLDRLWIQAGEGMFNAVMVSPADKDEFLSDLAAKAGLTRVGAELHRLSS
jgi:uncharacterized membrane protein YdbT with pleckstrin-like domain